MNQSHTQEEDGSTVSKYTLDDMHEIAKARGGKCLSDTYENNSLKLLWECSEAHKWRATPNDVLNNNLWCVKCTSMSIAAAISKLILVTNHEPIHEQPEIGRLCIKSCGKDSGRICVVIEKIDDNYVMVDGYSRRKRINIKHIIQTNLLVEVQKGAQREAVIAAIKAILL